MGAPVGQAFAVRGRKGLLDGMDAQVRQVPQDGFYPVSGEGSVRVHAQLGVLPRVGLAKVLEQGPLFFPTQGANFQLDAGVASAQFRFHGLAHGAAGPHPHQAVGGDPHLPAGPGRVKKVRRVVPSAVSKSAAHRLFRGKLQRRPVGPRPVKIFRKAAIGLPARLPLGRAPGLQRLRQSVQMLDVVRAVVVGQAPKQPALPNAPKRHPPVAAANFQEMGFFVQQNPARRSCRLGKRIAVGPVEYPHQNRGLLQASESMSNPTPRAKAKKKVASAKGLSNRSHSARLWAFQVWTNES